MYKPNTCLSWTQKDCFRKVSLHLFFTIKEYTMDNHNISGFYLNHNNTIYFLDERSTWISIKKKCQKETFSPNYPPLITHWLLFQSLNIDCIVLSDYRIALSEWLLYCIEWVIIVLYWVSDYCFKWTIFKLYYGENKIFFDHMMMMSDMYKMLCYIVLLNV